MQLNGVEYLPPSAKGYCGKNRFFNTLRKIISWHLSGQIILKHNFLSANEIHDIEKRTSTLRALFPELNFPLSFNSMVLVLSWNAMLKITLSPWDSVNLFAHVAFLVLSTTATNSTSVEILELTFCLVELDDTVLKPILNLPLEWILMSGLTPSAVSACHYRFWLSSVLSVDAPSFVPSKNDIILKVLTNHVASKI